MALHMYFTTLGEGGIPKGKSYKAFGMTAKVDVLYADNPLSNLEWTLALSLPSPSGFETELAS